MTATMALYWIDVLGTVSFISMLAWIIVFFLCAIAALDPLPDTKVCWGFLLAVSLVFGATAVFIPSSKTMYMMMATNYAGESQLPEKVLKAIEVKLDEIIGEKE